MITGQGNGQGGREHGQKCDQLARPALASPIPAARAHVAARLGHHARRAPAARATPRVEIMNAIHRGEIKGLLSICFNPLVSLPDANFTREALEKLEFFGVIDFFLSETAHACRRGAGRQPAGGGRRRDVPAPKDASSTFSKAVDPPGDARRDSRHHLRPGAPPGHAAQYFPFREPREIFEELREASRGGIADYYGITYEKIDRQMGVFWPCPSLDHPGTPRLFEDGRSYTRTARRTSSSPNGATAAIRWTTSSPSTSPPAAW